MKFWGTERIIGYTTDNLINYNAGPIQIRVLGWTKEIEISTSEKYKHLLNDFLSTAKEVWEFNDTNIVQKNELCFIIKFDLKIICNFLDNNIVYD